MAKDSNLLLLGLGGAALVLWLASQKKASTGGTPISGGVILGGNLGNVQVGQAGMGQGLYKTAFDTVGVTFPWQPDTRDKNTKLLKPWSYWVRVRMGHSTMLGWKDAAELGFANTGTFNTYPQSVTLLQQGAYFFSAPDDANQAWDIHVELYAAKPQADGNTPDPTNWLLVAEGKHDQAFTSLAEGVQLGGSLGIISVAQQARTRHILLR